jgi:hypothetical protein
MPSPRAFRPLLISGLLLLPPPESGSAEPRPSGARLLFTGDILLARNVLKERNSRRIPPWRAFDSLFHKADWVMGNFEGAVGVPGECIADTLGPCFAVPDSLVVDLKNAGFSALSLANNHAMDLGPAGLERSRKSLSGHGLVPLDFDASPYFHSFDGHPIAFISLSLVPGKDGERQELPGIALTRKLRLARNFAERIVVFIHWGSELQDWPNPEQITAARWLVRHGADLILGAHPHVVQAPACVEGRPVFYSLGNHLFDQKYPQTRQGLIADCALGPRGFSCRTLRTEAAANGYYPVLKGEAESAAGAESADGPALECPDTTQGMRAGIGPLALETRRSGESVAYGWRSAPEGKERISWVSRSSRLLSASPFRLREKLGKEFLFSLENHFSTLDHEVAPRPYVYELTASGPIARWRGSALAWPLLDAAMLPGNEDGVLCALHRGDSFLAPDSGTGATRRAAYRWNGFGFGLLSDSLHAAECREALE